MADEKITSVVSEQTANIANMIASQDSRFPDIEVIEQHKNIFELPEALKKFEKDYAFCWVAKDTRMIQRRVAKGWKVCNRVLCPWIPTNMFSSHGGLEGTHGHILAYRPKDLNEAYKKSTQNKSNEQIKIATKADEKDKKGSPFYTAKLSPEEEKSDGKPGEVVQGRDF